MLEQYERYAEVYQARIITFISAAENEHPRRRLATLSLPSLLNRCRTTLLEYVADESLRGHIPFPRVREEELLYVLRKLLRLRLWPGTLWAALSDNPTKYATALPSITDVVVSADATPSRLIADAVRRSSIAHLFHFYSALTEIASISRPLPAMPIPAKNGGLILSHMQPLAAGSHGNGTVESNVSTYVQQDVEGTLRLDARGLARTCLLEIGKEMGASC